MDQPFIPAGLEQLLQFAILIFVVFGFFRQFATQRDIKGLSDRIGRVEAGQSELKDGQAALETRQAALETRLGALENQVGNVEAGQSELKAGQVALEIRLSALENQVGSVKGNVRELGKKVDASLELHNAVRTDIQVLQAAVKRLDSYFETPKLKSS